MQAFDLDAAPKPMLPSSDFLTEVTLFCFTTVSPQGPAGEGCGYEQPLVDAMRSAKTSNTVFACEASAVYEAPCANATAGASIKDVFAQVWGSVKASGAYLEHDWTVKVDAEAVFLPSRLKLHLIMGLKPPAKTAVYLNSFLPEERDETTPKMTLQVMSMEAVSLLLENLAKCKQHIRSEHWVDVFTMNCLNAIGVGYMEDSSLIDDRVQTSFNPFDVDICMEPSVVAFTPYVAVNAWMGCQKLAEGRVTAFDFVSCSHRLEGEACSMMSSLDHASGDQPGTGILA